MLSVPDEIRGMPYQWPENVSQLPGHPICDHTPAGYYGPFCIFWVAHRIFRLCAFWVKSFVYAVS